MIEGGNCDFAETASLSSEASAYPPLSIKSDFAGESRATVKQGLLVGEARPSNRC
jgi:hypothetical protein